MHYGKDYFAKLTEDETGYMTTVEALNKKYADKIGQRKRVTSADAAKVNILYGCAGINLVLNFVVRPPPHVLLALCWFFQTFPTCGVQKIGQNVRHIAALVRNSVKYSVPSQT